MNAYFRATREPRYSLLFALPLLLLYETLAFGLSGSALVGVRNGADVLLKSAFVAFGGQAGLIAFGVLLLGCGVILVWRDWKGKSVEWRWFLRMALEAMGYGLGFGLVAGTLTGGVLRGIPRHGAASLAVGPFDRLGLASQLMVSLGAGIYEELLFRVLVVGALAWLGRRVLGWKPLAAGVAATLLGALIFAAFHYIGPYGDRLELASFIFRTISGLLFSGLYLLRGYGITAWTHALYDVLLAI